MLGDRVEPAVEIGSQAFEMATSLGLDEIRAHALTNMGTARAHLADSQGIGDLEESIRIAGKVGSPEIIRAYNNLFASYATLGMLDRAANAVRAGLVEADRFGATGMLARWVRFERIHIAYWEGRWDESLELIEESLSAVGPAHALSRWAFEMRGRIRLARGDVAGALDDAKTGLELAREAKDPQTLYPALSFGALASLEAGRIRDAEGLVDELLACQPANHAIPHHISPLFDLAWILAALDRSQELVEATEQATIRTPHVEAAQALAQGNYVRAADLYVQMGARPNEAYTRLRAAEQFMSAGRRTQAFEQLDLALVFWRSVGANRYIGQGETLLAATA